MLTLKKNEIKTNEERISKRSKIKIDCRSG